MIYDNRENVEADSLFNTYCINGSYRYTKALGLISAYSFFGLLGVIVLSIFNPNMNVLISIVILSLVLLSSFSLIFLNQMKEDKTYNARKYAFREKIKTVDSNVLKSLESNERTPFWAKNYISLELNKRDKSTLK